MNHEKKSLLTPVEKLRLKENREAAARQPGDGHDITIVAGEVWLDKQAVLNRMHICARTLQNWRSKKILKCARVGGRIYYRESDLADMLRKAVSRSRVIIPIGLSYLADLYVDLFSMMSI